MADDSAPLEQRMNDTMSAAYKSANAEPAPTNDATTGDVENINAAAEVAGAPKVGERPIDKMGKPRDESGRFTKATTDDPVDKTKIVDPKATVDDPTKVNPSPTPTALKAPSSWKPESQAKFATLDPELQQQIVEREENFHKGLTQYADAKRQWDGVQKTIQPYQSFLRAEGITAHQALQEALDVAATLRRGTPQQKQQLLRDMAQGAGIDLGAPAPNGEGEPEQIPPVVRQLQEQVQQLTAVLQNQEQAAQSAAYNEARGEVTAFESAKDASGNPKYPHLADVREHMAKLMNNGMADSLADAYEQAIYMVPSVREKVIAGQRADAAKKQADEEASRAAAARAAVAANVRATPVAGAGAPVGSMEDTMRAAFRRSAG